MSEAQLSQIDELNSRVKLRIAPSLIHGVGVFAVYDIPKGIKLYADHVPKVYNLKYANFGKLFDEVRQLLLERWPQIVNNNTNFIYPDARMTAYMNHAPTLDQVNYDAVKDLTLKPIAKGEEILEDYTKIPNYDIVFPWLKKAWSLPKRKRKSLPTDTPVSSVQNHTIPMNRKHTIARRVKRKRKLSRQK